MDTLKLHKQYKETLEGAIFPTKRHGEIEILKYINKRHVQIKFKMTGTIRSISLNQIRTGVVSDYFASVRTKSICGVGFIGLGSFSTSNSPKVYRVWSDMLRRCYSENVKKRDTSYIGCCVVEEWHNFQNFAVWYNSQIHEYNYELDKDIIDRNNKEYGPNKCCLVPGRINKLFIRRRKCRGKYPLGVSRCKHNKQNPFVAEANIGMTTSTCLGYYDTPEKAFEVYKQYKEQFIKQFAEEFKDKIDIRVYEAMIKYKVEITD